MILFETISLDSACGALILPAEDEGIVPFGFEWEPFRKLRDRSTGKDIFALEEFSRETRVIVGGILVTAKEKLKNSITAGVIEREAELFSSGKIGLAIPEFYTNPQQFTEMLRMSVSDESFQLSQRSGNWSACSAASLPGLPASQCSPSAGSTTANSHTCSASPICHTPSAPGC